MSCHRFKANQFRLFLHSEVLCADAHAQTKVLPGTAMARVAFNTLREKVIKVAATCRS